VSQNKITDANKRLGIGWLTCILAVLLPHTANANANSLVR